MRSRLRPCALALVVALAALSAGAASAEAKTRFTLVGHGWGHGIGMSQYGALGFAQHGYDHRRILAHYYTGTTVARLPGPVTMRVLLAAGRRSYTVDAAAWLVLDDEVAGTRATFPAGRYRVEPGAMRGRLRLWSAAGARYVAQELRSARLRSTGAPLRVAESVGAGYAGASWRGALRVLRRSDGLALVNAVPLESYLRGVVPREMPAGWPAAALRAQAVAARSYAAATRKPASDWDAYADTRSQVYGPVEHEAATTDAAVAATAGQVVWHSGAVATTFFSSSSGGRTASMEAAWGSSFGRPYLVAVRDPYDGAGGNPNHDWAPRAFTPAALARALGLAGRVTRVVHDVDAPSRRVLAVSVERAGAAPVRLAAGTVHARLGLRSTWFRLLATTLVAPATVTGAEPVRLTGRLWPRPARRIRLEVRVAGLPWRPLDRPLRLAADGRFAIAHRPDATAEYRLDRGPGPAVVVRVVVKPAPPAAGGHAAASATDSFDQ
jgi:stage II sporulation protein D